MNIKINVYFDENMLDRDLFYPLNIITSISLPNVLCIFDICIYFIRIYYSKIIMETETSAVHLLQANF